MRFSLLFLFLLYAPSLLVAQQTLGLFQSEESASEGFTLFGNNKAIYLIDKCGYVVNTWESDFDPGLSSYLLENGNLLRTAKVDNFFSDAGVSGRFELFDWEGNLLWNFEYSEENIQAHHDIAPLPNGHLLVILWEKISEAEAQQNGRKYDGEVWSEKVIELEIVGNQQANIVWEWRLWDHLIQDNDPTKPNFGKVADHPELVDLNYIGEGQETSGDWAHFNAISYHPELDQIALSARHLSEIWIIDHSTTSAEAQTSSGGRSNRGGDLLYRYGNPQAYQRGTPKDQVFFKQHDIRWVPAGHPWAGSLMVFNNLKTDSTSSVEVWSPPLNSDGNYDLLAAEAYGPMTPDWSYTQAGFSSRILSGAHFLPNENLFITEGVTGRLFEVNPAGEKVWEYINPSSRNGTVLIQGDPIVRNDVFRATKYPVDYAGFVGKNLSSGNPIERNPLPNDCDTTRVIVPVVGVEITLRNNPVADILTFYANFSNKNIQVILNDLSGKEILQQRVLVGENDLDLANFPTGIYLLRVIGTGGEDQVFKVLKK